MRSSVWVKQKGLSLVEMMIAMSLGAIVTVGTIQLFTANSDTYNLMQGQSRMQESARFSLDFIGRSIQNAGYKGCWSQNEEVLSTIVPESNIPYEYSLIRGMEGYDAGPTGWSPPLDDLDTAFIAGNEIDTSAIISRTDVLTIRYISTTEAVLSSDLINALLPIEVTIPPGGLGFEVDDIVMIHDCEKSTLFRVTEIDEDTPSAGLAEIGHDTGDTDATRNTFNDPAGGGAPFEQDFAAISTVRTATFFIAPGGGINNVGDRPFSLWRKFGTDAPVEMVEGVENLQVLYGLDTDNDGTPNQYVQSFLVGDWADVRTVRVSVTVNSVDDVGATSVPSHGCTSDSPPGLQPCIEGESVDGLLRRTFHQTIQLRNKG